MLEELQIRNFAIIDELTIKFQSGMNVFTGETGAGKSIIVDAIELVVGGKAETDMIRAGYDESEITASFDISALDEVKKRLSELGYDESEIILRRVLSRSGKSRAYINGKLVPVSLLKEVGALLIDIHGQHQHQSLLNPATHLEHLDRFAGLLPLRERYSVVYFKWVNIKDEINKLREMEKIRSERMDFLSYEVREIEEAKLNPDEEEYLKTERQILSNSEKFLSFARDGYDNIYAKEGSVLEVLNSLKKRAEELLRVDPALKESVDGIENSIVLLNEVAMFLQKYIDKFNFDPARLDEIESRLALIGRLKKKYGGTIQEILQRCNELKAELKKIESADERLRELEKEEAELYKELNALAEKLREMRIRSSKKLKKGIESELNMLGMEKAIFEVSIKESDFQENGADDVEFFISTNPGEEVRRLAMVVSGGELSRIMLAMKKVLAGCSGVPVLIFDEIDAGIGGAVAEVVGKKLKEVSEEHQVLCVTHLPQIACYAGAHYFVSKQEDKGRTVTRVKQLDKQERIEELARMISGLELTKKSREYAKELLERVS